MSLALDIVVNRPYFRVVKRILFICFCLWSNVILWAQQTPTYSMKALNLFQSNPAFAGVSDQLNVFAIYRSQWQDHIGSPKQFAVNASLPFYKFNGGLGVQIQSSNHGPEQFSEIDLGYSYHLPLGTQFLSIGASVGLAQLTLDGSELITPDGSYIGGINHNDPILNALLNRSFYINYSISAFYANDLFDAGLTIKNPFTTDLDIGQDSRYGVSPNVTAFFKYYMPFYDGWQWEPYLHINTNFNQFQIEFLNLVKYGNIFGGIGSRGYSSNSFESLIFLGGLKFNNSYTISYSFDVSVTKLRTTSDGSHEIMFRYDLNREVNTGRPPKTIYNPRNL